MPRVPLPARAPVAPHPTRSAGPTHPLRPSFHLGLVTAFVLLVAGIVTSGTGTTPPTAVAAVVHQTGFDATVAGWTSWYGSYGLGDLGWGWCIDHGIPAPDAAYGYVPISIDGETDGDAQAAMAWAASMHQPTTGVDAAAVMLVQHDLRQAVYPFGTLNVDALSVGNLAGFGGAEGAVLERAQSIKADALAHSHLRAPFTLTMKLVPADPGVESVGWAVLTDANGAPVPGAPVTITSFGPALTSPPAGVTLDDGSAGFTFVVASGVNQFTAAAEVADPHPSLLGPTAIRAQRIIQPRLLRVDAEAQFTWTPPTTPPTTPPPTSPPTTPPPATTSTSRPPTTRPSTTTTRPSTTTSRPSTTTTHPRTTSTSTSTTSSSTTSSTAPPGTAPPETTPPDTTPPGTTPPETATTPPSAPPSPPSPPAPRPPSARGSLPTTGSDTRGLALIGTGLVVLGGTAADAARRRRTHRTGPVVDG